ncbi:MAG: hypothetical protein H6833_06215 [Planctomycetes bacterium]|nr:hypothetical protein [Planctomycetota bacterium]
MHVVLLPRVALVACSFLAFDLAAQSPARGSVIDPSSALEAHGFRVPVHTTPGNPHEDRNQLWAAGDDYKASFREAFTFYPLLGPSRREHLPWRFEVSEVVMGNVELDTSSPEVTWSSWRVQRSRRGWSEVYDVLPAGVEQSFVIHERPAAAGDLVVCGKVVSPLVAPTSERAHRALEFADAFGNTTLRYGEAFAFDADGNRTPVETSYDGHVIRLTVPARWIAQAQFPVTIDPLTSSTVISSWGSTVGGTLSSVDICHEAESLTSNVLIAYTRAFTATDHDVYAVLCNDDYTNVRTVYADLSSQYSDQKACTAFVAGADRWLIGMQRDYSTATGDYATIRLYYHDKGNLSFNSGIAFSIVAIGNESFTNPDLGGTASFSSGEHGMLVYQRDLSSSRRNTPNSEIIGVPIRATTTQFLSAYVTSDLPVGTRYDRENPTVNQVASGLGDGWIAAWQEFDSSLRFPDVEIHAVRTDDQARRTGSSVRLVDPISRRAVMPKIAGSDETYLLTYGLSGSMTSSRATGLRSMRVDWSVRSAVPSLGTIRTIASSSTDWFENEDLAFDRNTRSHWVATYASKRQLTLSPTTLSVARMGGSGAVTEAANLLTNSSLETRGPAVAYDARYGRFAIAYTTTEALRNGTQYRVRALHMLYPPTATRASYGLSCGPGRITAGFPFAGNYEFAVELSNVTPGVPWLMLLALQTGSIPLDPIGMIGCTMLVDPSSVLVSATGTTDRRGNASTPLPLPDDPVFTGDLYFQYLYLAQGINPANLATTSGLLVRVR